LGHLAFGLRSIIIIFFFLLARVQSDDLVVGHALQQKLGLGGSERVMEKL
jgi:hypothetical protein